MVKKIQKDGYFNSTTDLIINENDIKLSLQASQQQTSNKIAQWISEGSGWTIQSIENHYINIVNYNPLKGSSYIKLPQELKVLLRRKSYGFFSRFFYPKLKTIP